MFTAVENYKPSFNSMAEMEKFKFFLSCTQGSR